MHTLAIWNGYHSFFTLHYVHDWFGSTIYFAVIFQLFTSMLSHNRFFSIESGAINGELNFKCPLLNYIVSTTPLAVLLSI